MMHGQQNVKQNHVFKQPVNWHNGIIVVRNSQFQICLQNVTRSCKSLVDGSKTYAEEHNVLDWPFLQILHPSFPVHLVRYSQPSSAFSLIIRGFVKYRMKC